MCICNIYARPTPELQRPQACGSKKRGRGVRPRAPANAARAPPCGLQGGVGRARRAPRRPRRPARRPKAPHLVWWGVFFSPFAPPKARARARDRPFFFPPLCRGRAAARAVRRRRIATRAERALARTVHRWLRPAGADRAIALTQRRKRGAVPLLRLPPPTLVCLRPLQVVCEWPLPLLTERTRGQPGALSRRRRSRQRLDGGDADPGAVRLVVLHVSRMRISHGGVL